jgi:hypothetical protein
MYSRVDAVIKLRFLKMHILILKDLISRNLVPWRLLKVNICSCGISRLHLLSLTESPVRYQHYSWVFKAEASLSSKTLLDFQHTKWRYIPGGRTVEDHGCENPKSFVLISFACISRSSYYGRNIIESIWII